MNLRKDHGTDAWNQKLPHTNRNQTAKNLAAMELMELRDFGDVMWSP